jgi:hypothetical protein
MNPASIIYFLIFTLALANTTAPNLRNVTETTPQGVTSAGNPDLAVVSINYTVARRTSTKVTIRTTATVKNIGLTGVFSETRLGRPEPKPVFIRLFEGETRRNSKEVAVRSVSAAKAGTVFTLTADHEWETDNEFFPNYYLEIVGKDGRADNNKMEKEGDVAIRRLVR